jgi:26S proteasome regulatory subunit T5
MNVSKEVNFTEISRTVEDFNGAQVKAVTVEAGMCALRRGGEIVVHEDYVEGIAQVQAKKKSNLNYFA